MNWTMFGVLISILCNSLIPYYIGYLYGKKESNRKCLNILAKLSLYLKDKENENMQ